MGCKEQVGRETLSCHRWGDSRLRGLSFVVTLPILKGKPYVAGAIPLNAQKEAGG